MQTSTTIGLDIAKAVFEGHGIDVTGKVVSVGRHRLCLGISVVRSRAASRACLQVEAVEKEFEGVSEQH